MAVYTFTELRTPKDQATNKKRLYEDLVAVGFSGAFSWEDGTPPSALVEIEAGALTEQQGVAKAILDSGFNEWASGDALTEHARQVYDHERLAGRRTRGGIQLTDTGAGPFNGNDPAAFSFSAGEGGLLFNGVAGPKFDIPLNRSVVILVEAETEGGEYNVSAGAIDTFVRNVLPGVIVTNLPNWLQVPGAVVGSSGESDSALRKRDRVKWGTLGRGSPQSAYEEWVRSVDPAITRVEVFTNLDLLDPGVVTILIAGDSGGLPALTVQSAQSAVAPAQIGGDNIPETARAVVSSAVNNIVPVSGTLYVQAEYNTPEFRQLILSNLKAFEKALAIGAKISWERLLQVTTSVAGLDPNIISDVTGFSPSSDVIQNYWQVAVLDASGLVLVSV